MNYGFNDDRVSTRLTKNNATLNKFTTFLKHNITLFFILLSVTKGWLFNVHPGPNVQP